jgi:L-ascorbate metabolism protein UlaG (beta-lactamase superfamily)
MLMARSYFHHGGFMSTSKGTQITWLGHATVLVQTPKGTNILIDPFIAHNPKYPQSFQLPAKIDYILLSHGHGDHMADAAPVAQKHGSKVVAIYELADYVSKQGAKEIIGMNVGGTVQIDDVAATMVDAKHSSGAEDDKGVHYVGVAVGFVLEIAGGPTLYHAGDTCVFGDMSLIRELYEPQVAMLPIGGHYTMGPKEAALACKLLAPKTVLPIHWGTFPPLTGTPEALAKLVEPGVKVDHWKPGDVFEA